VDGHNITLDPERTVVYTSYDAIVRAHSDPNFANKLADGERVGRRGQFVSWSEERKIKAATLSRV
jgi:hypothetical protein